MSLQVNSVQKANKQFSADENNDLPSAQKQRYLSGNKTETSAPKTPRFVSNEDAEELSAKAIYFRWIARLVMLCTIISMSFFLSATLVIFRLVPEIVVEPLLIISQDNSETMARYEPIDKKMPSITHFTEIFVKQYVIMRNTVVNDENEMATRWGQGGIVHYMSSPKVYNEFVKYSSGIKGMYEKDYSSEVKITKVSPPGKDGPNRVVWFTIYNLSQNSEGSGSLTLKVEKYKASISVDFYPKRIFISPRLINPLGFTVMSYSQDKDLNE